VQVDARTSPLQIGRSRPRRRRLLLTWGLPILAVLAVLVLAVGFAFAGSPDRIAAGVTIGGVNVGGMSPEQARTELQRRFDASQQQPVEFTAAGHTFGISPAELGVQPNLNDAIAQAQRVGAGSGPLRGFRRLALRFFGSDVTPEPRVFAAALTYELQMLARKIDVLHADAKLELSGGRPVVAPGRAGAELDQRAAGTVILAALVGFPHGSVALPVRVDPVRVTAPTRPGCGSRWRRADHRRRTRWR